MRTRFRKPLLYPLSYGGSGRRVALRRDEFSRREAPDVCGVNWGIARRFHRGHALVLLGALMVLSGVLYVVTDFGALWHAILLIVGGTLAILDGFGRFAKPS